MKTPPSQARLEARRKKLQKLINSAGDLESLVQGGGEESLESMDIDGLRGAKIEALDKVVQGDFDAMREGDFELTEAVVEENGRQVSFVINGSFEDLPDPWLHLNVGLFRTNIESAIPAIGRVERFSASGLSTKHVGTGFIVGNGLMMTNRHVAAAFVKGVGTGSQLAFIPGISPALDFGRERDFIPTDLMGTLKITGIRMIHPFWDMALLEVTDVPSGIKPLKLSVESPEELISRNIAVIGYPGRGNDRSAKAVELEEKNFGDIFGVKRIAPGEIDGRESTLSYKHQVPSMIHDCSTLAGNSGSALVAVDSGLVLGLHFKGITLEANFSVPMHELARDRRVTELLEFEGIVPATNAWDDFWNNPVAEEAILVKPRTPGVRKAAAAVPSRGMGFGVTGSANDFTLTIPLNVSVSLGQVTQGTAELSDATAGAEALESFQIPVMYDGMDERTGYDPAFLEFEDGSEVPLPKLTAKGEKVVARVQEGEDFELKYHHFSIVMHKKRRLALFTAANLDWRRASPMVNGSKPTRGELSGIPEGVSEQWVTDDRIPEDQQLPDIFFTRDNKAFDKGHLVRRDDMAWGSSFEDIQMANGDTYYTTNCSPQVKGFNQAPFGDYNWGDLENMIQKATKAEKAILFSGPVLAKDDRFFLGVTESGPLKIQVPRRFWKIIVAMTPDGVKAYGFLPEQDLSGVPTTEEMILPEEWEDHLVSIKEIESALGGLVSLDWCKKHDVKR
ncbi:DNA/RNA non-specific endonuclease [Luteolibacter flavescens]|uniref:Serine protease n=1 Tax=Luteolibacter flavescens TaxID=1859460 RepID=A0ABT3FUB0_9BACT|nr:DNA/RNA non-specific endonuclease [Luteolibacter flavescens]MCW1887017.1 DNA/RNA non-specific endonuclease [Luteolibacter flavescens]